MISETQLAKLAYVNPDKLWSKFTFGAKGAMGEAIRRLADIDHRKLHDQVRHLVEIGIRYEIARLESEAAAADDIKAKLDRKFARDIRRALAQARLDRMEERRKP